MTTSQYVSTLRQCGPRAPSPSCLRRAHAVRHRGEPDGAGGFRRNRGPRARGGFRAEFHNALQTAIEKRDRVAQFLAHLESQITLAKAEIARLQERRQMYERAVERVEEYVIAAIEKLGPDAKGKYPKLEGKTIT